MSTVSHAKNLTVYAQQSLFFKIEIFPFAENLIKRETLEAQCRLKKNQLTSTGLE